MLYTNVSQQGAKTNMLKNLIRSFFILIITSFLLVSCSAPTKSIPSITPQQTAALYNPQNNSILGNPNGNVTLVVLFDYNCPYCRKMEPLIIQLAKNNPNLRVVFKEFLLFGPASELATRAALAAQQQGKYIAMHNALMTADKPLDNAEVMLLAKKVGLNTTKLTEDMSSTAINQQIDANDALVDALNIQGAPVLIFANSAIAKNPQDTSVKQMMFMGSASLDQMQQVVSEIQSGSG
jgi:protein-disulfide isomerase